MDLLDIQTKAAQDQQFRTRLIADPAATLAAEGVDVPSGVRIELHESTPSAIVLCLPPVAVGAEA